MLARDIYNGHSTGIVRKSSKTMVIYVQIFCNDGDTTTIGCTNWVPEIKATRKH